MGSTWYLFFTAAVFVITSSVVGITTEVPDNVLIEDITASNITRHYQEDNCDKECGLDLLAKNIYCFEDSGSVTCRCAESGKIFNKKKKICSEDNCVKECGLNYEAKNIECEGDPFGSVTCRCTESGKIFNKKREICSEDNCVKECGLDYEAKNIECVGDPLGSVTCRCTKSGQIFYRIDGAGGICFDDPCIEMCGVSFDKKDGDVRCVGDPISVFEIECKCKESGKVFFDDSKECKALCVDNNGCKNGATCVDSFCKCLPGTSGDDCGIINECENGKLKECKENIGICLYSTDEEKAYCKCNDDSKIFDEENNVCTVVHAPSNLRAPNKTNTSVSLEWEAPISSKGLILWYIVEWCNSSGRGEALTPSNNTRITLKHLTPFMLYTFRVQGETTAGRGQWSNETRVLTDVGVPHAPTKLHALEKTYTTVNLKWEAPRPSTGTIFWYIVEWRNSSGIGEAETPSNNTQYTLERLTPFVQYTFRLVGETSAGRGTWSEGIEVATDVGVDQCVVKCGVAFNKKDGDVSCEGNPLKADGIRCECKRSWKFFDKDLKQCRAHCYSNNNCKNGAECKNGFCKCLPGTSGDTCDVINECETGELKGCKGKIGTCRYWAEERKAYCKCYDVYQFFDKEQNVCVDDQCTSKCGLSFHDKDGDVLCEGNPRKFNEIECRCKHSGDFFDKDSKQCRAQCSSKDDCMNGAECENGFCKCLPGTSGNTCYIINECVAGKLRNCKDDKGTCGYSVDKKKAYCMCNDERQIFNKRQYVCAYPCSSNEDCMNGAKCNNNFCDCLYGTSGYMCSIINECDTGKLRKCKDDKGTCQYLVEERKAYCNCNDERQTFDKEQNFCAWTCDPSDPKKVCKNGGRCEGDAFKKFCNCTEGTSGNYCEVVLACNKGKGFCGTDGDAECYFDELAGAAACKCKNPERIYDVKTKRCTDAVRKQPMLIWLLCSIIILLILINGCLVVIRCRRDSGRTQSNSC